MKSISFFFLISLLSLGSVLGQANDNCANATTLTPGAAQLCSQSITTTSTVQGGEYLGSGTCAATVANINQSVWYRFTATSANMFVEFDIQTSSGGFWCPNQLAMTLYNTSVCQPSAGNVISCQSYGALDGAMVLSATTLIPGNIYLVQISNFYNGTGNPKCQLEIPDFCIRVRNTPPVCNCAAPCATGCGYATTPTVGQVTSTCPEYVLNPLSDGGTTNTYCYSFTANSSNISFSMIITSNCLSGNVSGLTWNLRTSACGASTATGDLSSMSAGGLSIGTSYVLCYTYTIPTTCNHTSLYPYFVGASPLPVELTGLSGYYNGSENVINWVTVSENNNDYFLLERSVDGVTFNEVGQMEGAGSSQDVLKYTLYDAYFRPTRNYYRITQVDYDGTRTPSNIISIDNSKDAVLLVKTVNLLGQEITRDYSGVAIEIYSDGSQRKIYK